MAEPDSARTLLLRAARALVSLSQEELAKETGVSRMTVKRWEDGLPVRPAQGQALAAAFEKRGLVFIEDASMADGTRITLGVGLAKKARRKT